MVDVGSPGATFCGDPGGFSGVLERRERAVQLRDRPRYRDIFKGVVAAILIGALSGTVSAKPMPEPPLPVSDQGVTSYGTYSRLPIGKQSALVNILSGNLVIDAVDLTISGRGVPLVLQRFYNSQDTSVGVFGQGWSSFLDARLEFYPCTGVEGILKYNSASGASYPFSESGEDQGRTEGLHATFDLNSGNIVYDTGITLNFGSNIGCSRFLTGIADRNGNTITIRRDSDGTPENIVDTLNRIIKLTIENGLISTISPPGGLASITYIYDHKSKHQLNMVEQGDQTTTYRYGPDKRLSSIQDPRGFLSKFSYHTSPGCGQRVRKIEFGREAGGAPETFDTYSYTCPQKAAAGASTVFATVKDPNAHVTTYTWDALADPGPTLITDALGRERHLSYQPFYFDISRETRCLQDRQFDYNDDNGTLRSLSRRFSASDNAECGDFAGGELVTKYDYCDVITGANCRSPVNPLNQFLPAAITNPEGNTTAFGYDERGNLTSVTNALNNVVSLPRNPDGTLGAIERPRGKTKFDYSYGAGGDLRQVTVTDPSGRVGETNFDEIGRPEHSITPAGKQTKYRYDSLGRLKRVIYQDGTEVKFNEYDGNNNLRSMTDSTGTTTYDYDHRNRPMQKSSPAGTVSYTYDGIGNFMSKTDAGGAVSYEYDEVNRLHYLLDHDALITYERYDDNNRPVKVIYPHGMSLNREWDGAGRVKRIRATAPTSESPAGTLVDLSYHYEASLLFQFTDTGGTIAVYSYDPLNQLMSETKQTTDGRNAGQRMWTYDANNNRKSQTLLFPTHNSVTLYQYDDADQLMSTCNLDPLTGACAIGISTYGYDMDGNLKDRTDGLELDYDAADHTTAMTPPTIAGGAAAKLTMKYTGLDQTRRSSLKRQGAPATTFTYDATGIGPSSQQPGAAGASPDFFTRTPGARLISLHRGETTFYYIRDRLESVVALTGFNPWTGTTFVANRYRYSPWGEILAQSESVPQPSKFAGAEYEASTGLYKMGARYYDPAVGRFTQTDFFGGGYRYTVNNPVNLIDPTGYLPVSIILRRVISVPESFGHLIQVSAASFWHLIQPRAASESAPSPMGEGVPVEGATPPDQMPSSPSRDLMPTPDPSAEPPRTDAMPDLTAGPLTTDAPTVLSECIDRVISMGVDENTAFFICTE